ncbi:hypothetical protein X777_10676 [Ooceraea biroi]|uniref:Uncharacterized protein n=1 Tax=Ooceraea biroi TaxID=2015173 RepID=A0A026W382_OOCBI|nr:hypothetical protein X777_10676 [Ooceraea biroi]
MTCRLSDRARGEAARRFVPRNDRHRRPERNNDSRGREIIGARSFSRASCEREAGEMPREIKGPSPSSTALVDRPRCSINFQSRLNYAGWLSPIEEASPDGERAVCVTEKKGRKKGDHVKREGGGGGER